MAITENTYTGNGSTVLYSFTFPYLETTDIKVSLNGVNTTAYTLANATTVQFNSAPANGAAIRIYRQTDDASTKATFFPGSAIRSQDLNDNFLQVLYKSQETEAFAANTDASAIQATANTALANSNTAITTANAASATANGIAGTANTALSNANAAVSTANTANSTANTANNNATSALAVANAALPKAGGTMTGNITFNTGQTFPDVLPLTGGTLTGNLTVPSLNGGPLAGTRNRIINGDMRIDQRNAGASVNVSSGAYAVDRWYLDTTSNASFTGQRNAGSVTPPAGFTHYLGYTSTAAYTPGANTTCCPRQVIEGFNCADFAWGTANAQTVTLSFWVRSSLSGTHSGSLSSEGGNRSYVFSYSITAANTWEYKTLVIPGDTSGTWNTSNGYGIGVRFNLGTGTGTYGTTSTGWQAGNFVGLTSAVQVSATNGATFYITGVQLEAGTVATPFERRSYGQELALCQRYYAKTFDQSRAPANFTNDYAGVLVNTTASTAFTGNTAVNWRYPTAMRATPTVTAFTPYSGTAFTGCFSDSSNVVIAASAAQIGTAAAMLYPTGGALSANAYAYIHATASAEL